MKKAMFGVFITAVMAVVSYAETDNSDKTGPAVVFADRIKFEGIAVSHPTRHVWGCSPVVGEDGKIHLFAATFGEGFSWRTDADVSHFMADTPAGPFKLVDVVYRGERKTKGEWNHYGICNPAIKKVDGKYALFFIANSNRKAHHRFDRPSPENQSIGLMTAESVNGPWSEPKQVLAPSKDRNHWTHRSGNGVTNPAFVKYREKYYLYYKSNKHKYGVAVADKLEGPYVHHPQPVTKNKTQIEDGYAFVWKGKINLLTTDNRGIIARKGGLLWQSEDGINFGQPVRGFYPLGRMVSKSDYPRNRPVYGDWAIERPQLLLLDGEPAWFYAPSGSSLTGREYADCLVFRVLKEDQLNGKGLANE
jgi:hypothetical protein